MLFTTEDANKAKDFYNSTKSRFRDEYKSGLFKCNHSLLWLVLDEENKKVTYAIACRYNKH